MLKLAPEALDVHRFERLVDGAREAEPRDAAEMLRDALALWRGPPLADFTYDDFAQGEIARLEERRLVALERRVDADLALGRHQEVAGELAALVKQHPLRERLRAQLMVALYRSGRQAEALEAFADARRDAARRARAGAERGAAAAPGRDPCAGSGARPGIAQRVAARAADASPATVPRGAGRDPARWARSAAPPLAILDSARSRARARGAGLDRVPGSVQR